MPSVEQICNVALVLLKTQPIVSIDEQSEQAEQCKAVFDMLRDSLLENYAWTFATDRVQLQQSADTPPYQYDYLYTMPADCLMPLEARVDWSSGEDLIWVVESDGILTNAESVFLKYTVKVTETGRFSPGFALALSHSIASTLAYPITGNEKLTATYMQSSARLAAQAENRDAQKGTQEQFQGGGDSWVRSRNSARLIFDKNTGWLNQGVTL